MYSTNEDITDALLMKHVTKRDHAEAEKYVDKILALRVHWPSNIKSFPVVKDLAVTFASYKIACRVHKGVDSMLYRKVYQYYSAIADKGIAVLRLAKDKGSDVKPPMVELYKNVS